MADDTNNILLQILKNNEKLPAYNRLNQAISGTNSLLDIIKPTPLQNLLASPSPSTRAVASSLSLPTPKDIKSPLTKKWNPDYYRRSQERLKVTIRKSRRRIREITNGLTMPEITSVPIGCAKKMEAAILFFDLENFTSISSNLTNEDVLYMLNLIIPEMMYSVRHWNGEIEKNTGDGLMAIFGTETRNSFVIARDAIECAMAMKYIMINDIQPKLLNDGLPRINFRIGIEMGNVLISKIGINNDNFLTVVGDAANFASKLQSFADQNGICIAENFYNNLSPILRDYCFEGSDNNWNWHYTNTGAPYRFFHYNFDWPEPREWMKIKL